MHRRQFLMSIPLWASSFPALAEGFGPNWPLTAGQSRTRDNSFRRRSKPLLVSVEGDDLVRMLASGFATLPELARALRGKRVVLKPNATASEPYPVTTDVRLLAAILSYLKDAGAAEITICDSSSFAGIANDRVFTHLGYYSLARQHSVKARAIDSQIGADYIRVSSPDWIANKFLFTDRRVNQADFVINLATPKRHHVADFSCALKNNFGCTYGTFRMLAHSGSDDCFDQSLVEFADAVRPNLTVVDARSVLARFGPAFRSGKSEIVSLHRIVLSGDMVAADSYCGGLMEKADPTFKASKRLERQLRYAQALGLGECDLKKVEIVEV